MTPNDPSPGSSFRARVREDFRRFATLASDITGSAWAFAASVVLVLLWAASYPFFMRHPDGFNTWQLIINTLTNIITFFMVFIIQNMQNRDARTVHLKLDELIRAVHTARNEIVSIENLSDDEIRRLQNEFERIREIARAPQPKAENPKPE